VRIRLQHKNRIQEENDNCNAGPYRGQKAVIRKRAPRARDFTNRRYRHRGVVDEVERGKNRWKSRIRAKVQHGIGVIKRVFGFTKVRYRDWRRTPIGRIACALVNLFIARRQLLRAR
jgi:IS5 family transposase